MSPNHLPCNGTNPLIPATMRQGKAMTRRKALDSAALMAARHLREFGFIGWHLKQNRGGRPTAGVVAGDGERFERQLAQADHYAAGDFPTRDDSAIFLMIGKPRPDAGDGLVALTRHWTIKETDIVHRDGAETIYAVFCV